MRKLRAGEKNTSPSHTIKAANQTISEAKDFQQVDLRSVGLQDVCEIGSGWVCKQVLEGLALKVLLTRY